MRIENKDLKKFFENEVEKYGERVFSKNNKASVRGVLLEDFTFSHQVEGEKFYKNVLKVQRENPKYQDEIIITISEKKLETGLKACGKVVELRGCYKSQRYEDETGKHVRLYLSVRKMSIDEKGVKPYYNYIYLDGYLTKDSVYRKTPLGTEICDLMLAVNAKLGDSDYIPCIAWNSNARELALLGKGSHIKIYGRIQSREYEKTIEDSDTGEKVKKIAYEVSIMKYSFA